MVLPFFENFPQIPCVPMEAFPAQISHPAAVLTVDRSNETALSRLAAMHGPKLVVPEVWRDLLPNCGILISSALSGGSFRQRLEDAVRSAPKRCWLLLDPMQEEFRLPCPDGHGKRVTIIDYGYSFYSDTMCCHYTHFCGEDGGTMVLWDTEESLQNKLKLAKDIGFLGYVCLDILSDIQTL